MATDHSNEVVAAVDGDAIELTVQSAKFALPRMYAYALTDTLQALPILRHRGVAVCPEYRARAVSSL